MVRKSVLDFFEEMGGLLARFFGVINGYLGGFFRTLSDVLSRIGCGVAGKLKCLLRAIRSLDGHGLGAAIDMRDRTVYSLDPMFANIIDLDRCLIRSLDGVVCHYVRTFFETVEGVLGTVFGFDDSRLGASIHLGNSSVDGADYVICGPSKGTRQQQQQSCPKNSFHYLFSCAPVKPARCGRLLILGK